MTRSPAEAALLDWIDRLENGPEFANSIDPLLKPNGSKDAYEPAQEFLRLFAELVRERSAPSKPTLGLV